MSFRTRGMRRKVPEALDDLQSGRVWAAVLDAASSYVGPGEALT